MGRLMGAADGLGVLWVVWAGWLVGCGVDFARSINKHTPYVMYFSPIFKALILKFDP